MKKILLAFDGIHFSEGAFNFASQLNDLHSVLLVGVFVPQLSYANLWSYAAGTSGATYVPLLEAEDSDAIEKNIQRFEELCRKNFIPYKVHKDFYDFALPELKKETRFADLLIISSETFYKNIGEGDPGEYIREAVHSAECPVVIVPEHFSFPKINILAYDGSQSSVYAIKQFAYLFPELCNQQTIVVYSSEDPQRIPDQEQIEELVKQHFFDASFLKLDLDPKKYFKTWASENRNAILISGAFGRSTLSEMFHKSFIPDVISEHKLPVFIAHK
jgi:hypothetical protein